MENNKKSFALKKFLFQLRERLAVLQDAQLERSEKELLEVLKDKDRGIYVPIPTFAITVLVWSFIIAFPLLFILDPSTTEERANVKDIVNYYVPLFATMLVFFMNLRILVPKCFFRRRYLLFAFSNILLVSVSFFIREQVYFLINRSPMDSVGDFLIQYATNGTHGHSTLFSFFMLMVIVALVSLICILITVCMRQLLRAFVSREKKRMELEYELNFLRKQLSPHFLFNTLNNITSLIRIDPNLAETSMTKLSQLIRVMLYQTSDKILLKDDVGILEKYAELEKLRHDDRFDFVFEYELENPDFRVEPLLMMPLMENAMKHCMNPDGNSFAHIRIVQHGNELVFTSENSNFPRRQKANVGGLGLLTFKKRLELMYSGRYAYNTYIENGVYFSELRIQMN